MAGSLSAKTRSRIEASSKRVNAQSAKARTLPSMIPGLMYTCTTGPPPPPPPPPPVNVCVCPPPPRIQLSAPPGLGHN